MIKRTYPQSRLRRVRAKSYLRDLVAENHLSTNDLIQPIFIADQSETRVEIPSMPGIYRHNLQSLYAETEELIKKGSETEQQRKVDKTSGVQESGSSVSSIRRRSTQDDKQT